MGRQTYLTREEELALVERYRAGDIAALHELVWRHRFLVWSLAKRYGKHVPVADLIQEGYVGMLEAARRFDPTYGARFGTFARWWIRYYLQRFRLHGGGVMAGPKDRNGRRIMQDGVKTEWRLRRELGREPTQEEMAEALDVPLEKYKRVAVFWYYHPAEINEEAFGETSNTETRLDIERMFAAMANLSEREQRILFSRFFEERTLRELGEAFGCTGESIRQHEAKALAKLREALGVKRAARRAVAG